MAGICSAASAVEPKEKGSYIGAAGGLSLFDDDGVVGIGDGGVVGGGFGMRCFPTQNLSIGIQNDVYVGEDRDIFDMAVGSTQLSINFIF